MDVIFERITELRESNPKFYYLMRLSVKYEDFQSSVRIDRKKGSRLSENSVDLLKTIKSLRKRFLSEGYFSFDELREFEKSHNYTLTA